MSVAFRQFSGRLADVRLEAAAKRLQLLEEALPPSMLPRANKAIE